MNALKRTAGILAVLALVIVSMIFCACPGRRAGGREYMTLRSLATRVLAEHIAQHYPGSRVLIIGNPLAQESGRSKGVYEAEEAGRRGIEAGLAGKLSSTEAYPDLRPEVRTNPGAVPIAPGTTTPISYMMTDDAFDKLAAAYPQHDVFASLIGLPANLKKVKFWMQPNAPKIALLFPDLRVVGDAQAIASAFESGQLIAAVLEKPGASAREDQPAADYRVRFDANFLLVTPENMRQLAGEYPQLF